MEIKVREVSEVESKSTQEVEQELLQKHEAEVNGETTEEQPSAEEEPKGLSEEEVRSFLSERYGREINSLDELAEARSEAPELPEDVAAYYKFKQETGRGLNDFMKVNRNLDEADGDTLLKEYFLITEDGLDAEDVEMMMDDYKFDADLDDESDIKKAKLAKKKAVAKAKKYFEEQKEKYQAPLESRGVGSLEDSEEYQAYKQYVEQAKTHQEEQRRRKDWFDEKTNEVFSDGFKGFEFSIDDKSYVYTPGDRTELKKLQRTPEAWLNKYLDDKGLVKDAAGYHKSLAVAMNPEKFAQFFYEQGKANAVDDVMRKTKNINMSERSAPQTTTKGGLKIRAISQDSGRGLKIKSARRSS
tara:strand:- start:7341 stop:8411 length:1071 start_codon:yes stop_codon:yes gene_type:complete